MTTDRYQAGVLDSSPIRKKVVAAVSAFAFIFALLFQYRILSLLKTLGADITPLGGKFPIILDYVGSPLWMRPFFYTLEYFNAVWFNTLLGLLVAGAVAAFLPEFASRYLRGNQFSQHVLGAVLGIPNMLCSCCAACALPGLRKAGAGLGSTLSFFVSAPALNIVSIILAFKLLPWPLALARLLTGVIAAIGLTYVVTKLYPDTESTQFDSQQTGSAFQNPAVETSAIHLLQSWIGHTGQAALAALPILALGIFIIGILKTVLPFDVIAGQLGNDFVSVFLAALIGTVLMVPTFAEVLWVKELLQYGAAIGPVMALLVTLPAVSFPSLWVLGRVYGSYRAALSLGLLILLLGFVAGILGATTQYFP